MKADRRITHGHTRGGRVSPEYNSWANMRSRCENPRNDDFENYGGRGIKVCNEWSSFERFFEDMGRRPAGKTLDRIDVNQGYSPSNCRWANAAIQAMNRRRKSKNASGFKGVHRDSNGPGWQAEIRVDGIRAYLGCFSTPIDAAIAYNTAALVLWGRDAFLNKIPPRIDL